MVRIIDDSSLLQLSRNQTYPNLKIAVVKKHPFNDLQVYLLFIISGKWRILLVVYKHNVYLSDKHEKYQSGSSRLYLPVDVIVFSIILLRSMA